MVGSDDAYSREMGVTNDLIINGALPLLCRRGRKDSGNVSPCLWKNLCNCNVVKTAVLTVMCPVDKREKE